MEKKLYVAILLFAVNAVYGGGTNESAPRPTQMFMAGGGAVITENPYKGVGTKSRGIPFFLYKIDRFSLYGPIVNYSLFENDSWRASAIAKVRFEGFDQDDSRYLNGMDDREWTFELGGALSRAFDWGRLMADFSADVLGEHDGYELGLSYGYDFNRAFNLPALMITPSIGVNYRSSQLNDYYYGVRSSEAIAGRPQYDAGDSTGLTAGLRLNYRLDDRWSLMAMAFIEWLGDEITDSPIVDEDYVASFLTGIVYRF